MASWISKTWIEQALMASKEDLLPKITKAQILKIEETSTDSIWIGVISDKKLFVKARFSQVAVEQFKRDHPSVSMGDIQGGLVFVKRYFSTCVEDNMGNIEFILNIDQFKFAGGEGNTQFGSDIIDSSTYPPLQQRLKELWRQKQLMTMLHCDSHTSRFLEIEKILLEDHESVFIPEVTENLLADIPEWKLSCDTSQAVNIKNQTPSFESRGSNSNQQVSALDLKDVTSGNLGENQSDNQHKGDEEFSKRLFTLLKMQGTGKQTNEEEAVVTDPWTGACVSSSTQLAVKGSKQRKELITDFGPRMVANYGTENDSEGTQIGSNRNLENCVKPEQSSAGTSCQKGALLDLHRPGNNDVESEQERNNNCHSGLSGGSDGSDVVLISSNYVSSSQMSDEEHQPLMGLNLVTEHQLSQVKQDSDESYSVLGESRSAQLKSFNESIVQSSAENSEETADEHVLPCINLWNTGNLMQCSLTESQLETLLDTNISYDEITSHDFDKSSHSSHSEKLVKNTSKELIASQEKDPEIKHLRRDIPSADPFYLERITAVQCCISPSRGTNDTIQPSHAEKEETLAVCGENRQQFEHHFRFSIKSSQPKIPITDSLLSENRMCFPQASEKRSCDYEFHKHQSFKRKRSKVDGLMGGKRYPPGDEREARKVQFRERPLSPGSSSPTEKTSGSRSSSLKRHFNSHEVSLHLTMPVGLYSQQDPLILDTSPDSSENTDYVMGNESGIFCRDEQMQEGNSPSVLQPSLQDPCRLTTPTFDSLPSFQVPTVNKEKLDDNTPTHVEQVEPPLSSPWGKGQVREQKSGTSKKKQRPRRKKFNWFSDEY
ncbi:uncharacterized protein LOC114968499 isoform X1 [Acropora millepora]|uniref:uncharacterized protein LOC114968499 isoform X1 n=1 Tax=Acropora millepora TaxID=45264 RepID=UPI001CF466B8|nr:uncharacterized protein LOC114968499 isoform X1 [Acropora millepora]